MANRGRKSGGGSRGGYQGGYQGGDGYDGYDNGPPRPPQRPRRPQQKRGPSARRKSGRGFWGSIGYWGAVLGLWLAVFGVGIFIWVASDLPDPEELWRKTDRPSITYVDINGIVIDRRGAADAPPVDLSTVPEYVPQAVLAIEDRKFYKHWGFDFFGIGRAIVVNLQAGRTVQGASTLTQQLAKNLFLSSDQNLKRKAQELLLSIWLESRFTKDEILSLYLARVYFGAGAYGIEEASERYFNKEPANLTISEAALLAGLLKAPSRYSPVSSTTRAAERATIVLDVMERENVITHEQRLQAVRQPLRFVPNARGSNVGYFLDWIEPEVAAIVGEPTEDIIVETTLDTRHQTFAEIAIQNEIERTGRASAMSQAALVAISGDGGVRALVGGKSYNESEFNRAIDAKRQPGSAFKPFVYTAAFERGENPSSVRDDHPLKLGNWSPQNYDSQYHGAMTLLSAFTRSINTIAVQLSEEAGRDAVIRVARRLGIRSHIDPDPTLALGTQVLSPMELTAAYAPFSNGGAAVTPYGFKRVRTRSDRILWERATPQPRRVLDDTVLRNMNYMFRNVVTAGTARSAALPDRMVGGKTGTTSDYRDAWFVGFTGGYTAGVWVGNDDFGRKMNRVTGGAAPARIWRAFMEAAQRGTPARAFALPLAPIVPADLAMVATPLETNIESIDSPSIMVDGGAIVTDNNDGIKKPTGPDTNEAQPPNKEPEARSLDDIIKDIQEKKPS